MVTGEMDVEVPEGVPVAGIPMGEGPHKFVVERVQTGHTKVKNYPMFKIRARSIGIEDRGAVVFENLVLMPFYTDKSRKQFTPGAGIILGFLRAVGLPHKGKFKITPREWEGKEFGARIYMEEWDGKLRAKVRGYMTIEEYARVSTAQAASTTAVDTTGAAEEDAPF